MKLAGPGGDVASIGPAIGIDVGGTKLLGVRLERSGGSCPTGIAGSQTAERGPPSGSGATPAGVQLTELRVASPASGPDLARQVMDVIDRLSSPGRVPRAIGIGAPGLVDADGVLRFSPHLPGAVGTPLAAVLRAAYPSSSVWVGNDATAASWAEHLVGAATDVDDLVLVTLGTGIGGGVITGGVLVEGAHRFAGEFGHMVLDPHGPLCPCGKRGCWERFASGSGLGLLGREWAVAGQAPRVVALAGGDPEAVRGEHVTMAAAEGDPPAVGIMGRFAWWVALGLANLANIFDPALLLLGGGLTDAAEVLLGPTRAAFADLVEAGEARDGPPIRAAALGYRAGAVGAALLAAGRATASQ